MKKFLVLLFLFVCVIPDVHAQDTIKKKMTAKEWWDLNFRTSKKKLKFRCDSLSNVVDSLKAEIENNYIRIETSSEDSLNIEPEGYDDLYEMENGDSSFETPADPDSLLHVWYAQEGIFNVNSATEVNDSTEYISDLSDSLLIDRLSRMNSFISLEYNKILRNHILYYTQQAGKKTEQILGLAQYYMPIFEEIFHEYGLPQELKAMAIIESSLNPVAVSRAKARGMWQFMYSTAKRYGLEINSYVDERYDPIKSAHAAAKYLKDSYKIFGDWPLAIASYNCGAGNVSKAIRRSGGKKSFWDVYYFLPRETRGYVPSFMAALYLLKYYPEHNITPAPCQMPAYMDTIAVNKMLHFEQIAHFTGMSVEEIEKYNPQYLHNIIPGMEREYELKIPFQYVNKFIDNEDEIYEWQKDKFFNPGILKRIKETGSAESRRIIHKVKSGETLGHIALKYKVSINSIKRWNGLKSNNIRVGQRLSIYVGGSGAVYNSADAPKTYVSKGYVWYTVRSGDNLSVIASRNKGTSVNTIMKLNGLDKNSKIFPGMKLKLRKAN